MDTFEKFANVVNAQPNHQPFYLEVHLKKFYAFIQIFLYFVVFLQNFGNYLVKIVVFSFANSYKFNHFVSFFWRSTMKSSFTSRNFDVSLHMQVFIHLDFKIHMRVSS